MVSRDTIDFERESALPYRVQLHGESRTKPYPHPLLTSEGGRRHG